MANGRLNKFQIFHKGSFYHHVKRFDANTDFPFTRSAERMAELTSLFHEAILKSAPPSWSFIRDAARSLDEAKRATTFGSFHVALDALEHKIKKIE